MKTIETVRCPNCGSSAERHHLLDDQLIRTQCSACDYLMITCATTGKVIEAYAPGIDVSRFSLKNGSQKTHQNGSQKTHGHLSIKMT